MSNIVEMLAVLVASGAVLAKGIHSSKAKEKRLDEAWKLAAMRLRGEASMTPGPLFGTASRRIETTVNGTKLTVAATTERTWLSRGGQDVTRCETGVLVGLHEIDMEITPRGLLDKITRIIDAPQAPTGDPTFDQRFRVSGSPRALVREFLGPRLRERIQSVDEAVAIRGRTILIEREGHPEDHAAVVAMARYAELFVDRWHELAREPSRIAGRLGLVAVKPLVSLRQGAPVVVARGVWRGREVTMSSLLTSERVVTVFEFDALGEPFMLAREGNALQVSGAPDARIQEYFVNATETLLKIEREDNQFAITLDGLCPPVEESRAIVEALLDSSGGAGLYR